MVLTSYLDILEFWDVENWQGGITSGEQFDGCRETPGGIAAEMLS